MSALSVYTCDMRHGSLRMPNSQCSDIRAYLRGADVQLARHFHLREWECGCGACSWVLVSPLHVERLQELREQLGPIRITSGYRCQAHNAAVGGASGSQHLVGTATDIVAAGMTAGEVAAQCEHFDGLGRYVDFTHINSRGHRARWDLRSAHA